MKRKIAQATINTKYESCVLKKKKKERKSPHELMRAAAMFLTMLFFSCGMRLIFISLLLEYLFFTACRGTNIKINLFSTQ